MAMTNNTFMVFYYLKRLPIPDIINPIKAMADANIVGTVIFAGFIGIAIKRLTKKYSEVIKPAVDLTEAGYKIITSVAMTIIKFMPYAVVALLANTIAGRGIPAIISVNPKIKHTAAKM